MSKLIDPRIVNLQVLNLESKWAIQKTEDNVIQEKCFHNPRARTLYDANMSPMYSPTEI